MAKNRKTPDMNLPVWFDGQNINEALFCEEFLQERRIIFANGAFFTPDGRVTDDLPLRGEIYDKLKFCAVNNIPRKITHIYRGQTGYRAEPFAGCLQSRCYCAGDLAELSGWVALRRGHSNFAGVYRLLPDSLQQGAAHDGD